MCFWTVLSSEKLGIIGVSFDSGARQIAQVGADFYVAECTGSVNSMRIQN